MELVTSRIAASYLRNQIRDSEVEEFWGVALNPLCRVITAKMLFRGTVDACLIHPRDVFRFGLLHNATSILVGHNHPSGSSYPSAEDIMITQNLRRAGEILQIPLVDHIIVTAQGHYSFANLWKGSKFQ